MADARLEGFKERAAKNGFKTPTGEGDVGEEMDRYLHRAADHPDEDIDEYLAGIKKAADERIDNYHHMDRPGFTGGSPRGHMDHHLIQRRLGTVLRNSPQNKAINDKLKEARSGG